MKIIAIQYNDSNFVNKGDTVEIAYLNNRKEFVSREIRDNKISNLNIYDEMGKIKTQIIRYNDSLSMRTDKKLDKFGLPTEIKIFEIGSNRDTSFFIIKNQYNKDSTVVNSTIFNKINNSVTELEERIYGIKKSIISFISKDPVSHRVIQKRGFSYDNRNNNIESSTFDSSGILIKKDIYIYNKKNQLIKESHFENSKLDHYSDYFYEGDRRIHGIRGRPNHEDKYLKYFYE